MHTDQDNKNAHQDLHSRSLLSFCKLMLSTRKDARDLHRADLQEFRPSYTNDSKWKLKESE